MFHPLFQRYFVIFCPLFLAGQASALVTPTADPQHTTEQGLQKAIRQSGFAATPFPFWRNLGFLNQSSGVYMGGGYVLTAAHVGAGTFTMLDGSNYRAIPGSERRFRNADGSHADLTLFKIYYSVRDSIARLPSVPIRNVCPGRGCPVVMIGAGSGNATRKGTQPVRGFSWNNNNEMRWGLNRVEYAYSDEIETFVFRTPGYSTRFSRDAHECQATPGDSGGGVFSFHPVYRQWELCGIILAVDGDEGRAAFGNQTYIADLTILPKQVFSNRFLPTD